MTVIGAVLCGLVAGCTADAEPIVTDSPTVVAVESPSPSSTPSPTPTALSDDELLAMLPEGADRTDAIGAMVTAAFFLEQYAPMFQTGDTRVWEALSAEGCEYCENALANAVQIRDEGWTFEGGEIVVVDRSLQGNLESREQAVVSMDGVVRSSSLVSPDGKSQPTEPRRELTFGLVLVLGDGGWRVSEVVVRDA
ncbi:DUF6318 family protein [Demequina silvatica]|uniref:DUF6318 family protein n=1 Tax=Demequina silvatica TaxID=1638988 RepID=UPI0012E0385E|nr:DUF6318 family protein [Demequina silvatica]